MNDDHLMICRELAQLTQSDPEVLEGKLSHSLVAGLPEPHRQLCLRLIIMALGRQILSNDGLCEEEQHQIVIDQQFYLCHLDHTRIIDLKVQQLICPVCGEKGDCEHHGDINSSSQYVDEYVFVCVKCGFQKAKLIDGGDSNWNSWYTSCPFCCDDKSEVRELLF